MPDDGLRSPFALGDLSTSLHTAQEDNTRSDPASSENYLYPNLPPHIRRSQFYEDSLLLRTAEETGDSEYSGAGPGQKKRKRNKPTLSCKECVEKKIKCDRGRPHCLSCIRRGTECVYRIKAEPVEASDNLRQPAARRIYPPKARQSQYQSPPSSSTGDQGQSPARSAELKPALFVQQGSTDLLLSHVPYTATQSSNIFGIGAEYPFSNYWTLSSGLAEVIGVLPRKNHADILIDVFFESVDPVYPFMNKERFLIDYEGFWALDDIEKPKVDADFLALVFMMLAMGTQFIRVPGSSILTPQNETAEFYSSACDQSLRLFSYLNRTSVRAIQSMVLMTYFLLNSGRASDGWAFSGILIRQAYATGLNREPTLISPKFSLYDRLERRRLWHGIVCQDTFMSMSLRLPPAATHGDIDQATPLSENDESYLTDGSPESVEEDPFNGPNMSDPGYVQGMYNLAMLAQETISTPRSLSLPLAANPRQRGLLLARFRATYRSFPDAFRAWDEASIVQLAQQGNKRLAWQIMFLTGLFWHCMTLVQSEGLEEANATQSESNKSPSQVASSVDAAIRGTLEAANESMRAFFVTHDVLGDEGSVWWAFCHRAFSASIIVANLLKNRDALLSPAGPESEASRHAKQRRASAFDPLWDRARADVLRMLELLKGLAQLGDEGAKTRVEVLSNYL